eukprot:5140050-Amphidinium_carterae.1
MGWGHSEVKSQHAFPVSGSSNEGNHASLSDDEPLDMEEEPTTHRVEEPSPGQLRLIQRVHENLGHPRR